MSVYMPSPPPPRHPPSCLQRRPSLATPSWLSRRDVKVGGRDAAPSRALDTSRQIAGRRQSEGLTGILLGIDAVDVGSMRRHVQCVQ